MLEAGLILSRFLHFIAVLSLFGASLYPLYIFRGRLGSFGSEQTMLAMWLRRVLIGAVALTLVSGFGWFEFTTATMTDSTDAMMQPSAFMAMMMGTDFGPLWAARLAVTFVILMLLLRWPSRASLLLTPLFAGILLASLAGTGHARVTEGWAGVVHIASDGLHLVAAGWWLGGLWPLGFMISSLLRRVHDSPDRLLMGDTLQRFSGVGTLAVAVLVASGLLNGWFLVGSPKELVTTTYGWLLLAKIGLFLLMALLAAANRLWITPGLNRAAQQIDGAIWLRRLRKHVVAEQMLGILVIAVVSLLGTLQTATLG